MESQADTSGGVTLVVCRGQLDRVQTTVETIGEQTIQPMWMLLVDTGADTRTTRWLEVAKSESALVSVDSCDEATSIAECWNRALEWAFLSKDRDEALIVDSSVELLPETYEVMVKTLREHRLGMITAIRVESREKFRSVEDEDYKLGAHLDFNCFMISKVAWDKTGPFDPSQHGSEGHEMDVRMREKGMITASVNLPFFQNARRLFAKHKDKHQDESDDDPESDLPVGFPLLAY